MQHIQKDNLFDCPTGTMYSMYHAMQRPAHIVANKMSEKIHVWLHIFASTISKFPLSYYFDFLPFFLFDQDTKGTLDIADFPSFWTHSH